MENERFGNFFREIAESVKRRLCSYIGRTYILPHEWFWVMRDKIPFKPPINIRFTTLPVEISCLDNSFMVNILKHKYGNASYLNLLIKRKDIEEYA